MIDATEFISYKGSKRRWYLHSAVSKEKESHEIRYGKDFIFWTERREEKQSKIV